MGIRSTLREIIRGPNGTIDPVRTLFVIGGTNGVIAPVLFEIWALYKGQPWTPTDFCIAYGGMLSAVIAAGGIAIPSKDKGMAQAEATRASTTNCP